jgi:MFS family permease
VLLAWASRRPRRHAAGCARSARCIEATSNRRSTHARAHGLSAAERAAISTAATPEAPLRPPARALAALGLALFVMPLNSTMIAVALPVIGAALGTSATDTTQALMASYLAATIVLQTPGGKLGDVWGRHRALLGGQVLVLGGALGGTFAPDLRGLALARLAMAAGGALLMPAALATLRTVVPVGQRGRVFGAFGAVMAIATAAGPPLGGLLTESFGWQAVFWVNVPLVGLSLVLGAGTAPRGRARAVPPRLDWGGVALLAATLLAAVCAVRLRGVELAAALVACALALALFVHRELRHPDPVLDVRIFRARPYTVGIAVLAGQNFALYGPLFLLPYVLHDGYGIGAAAAGRVVVFLTGAMIVFGPIGGRLADRLGARRVVASAALVGTAGMLGLALAPDWQHPARLIPWMALIGLGMAGSMGPAQAAALSAVRADASGMAAGALTTLRYGGSFAGISLVALLVSAAHGDVVAVARMGFAIYAAAFGATVLAALALPRRGVAAS